MKMKLMRRRNGLEKFVGGLSLGNAILLGLGMFAALTFLREEPAIRRYLRIARM